ncbi:30S ribosomal protein S15 [Candidatus Pacebacteria bacterium]|nr:30S ribosomal protein S15 [Candidatus Paceibacterota bacterium]
MLTKTKKANAIKETQINSKDTGSADAQASILTKKIDELAKHLKKNKKDNHSRRGLLGMVADRQKHLNYLAKKSPERYKKVVKKLGLKSRI